METYHLRFLQADDGPHNTSGDGTNEDPVEIILGVVIGFLIFCCMICLACWLQRDEPGHEDNFESMCCLNVSGQPSGNNKNKTIALTDKKKSILIPVKTLSAATATKDSDKTTQEYFNDHDNNSVSIPPEPVGKPNKSKGDLNNNSNTNNKTKDETMSVNLFALQNNSKNSGRTVTSATSPYTHSNSFHSEPYNMQYILPQALPQTLPNTSPTASMLIPSPRLIPTNGMPPPLTTNSSQVYASRYGHDGIGMGGSNAGSRKSSAGSTEFKQFGTGGGGGGNNTRNGTSFYK